MAFLFRGTSASFYTGPTTGVTSVPRRRHGRTVTFDKHLSTQIAHKYDAEHDPITPVPDADMMHFLLESSEIAQSELVGRSGIAESTTSEILGGKTKLSRRHIAALSGIFRMSPAVFLHEAIEM